MTRGPPLVDIALARTGVGQGRRNLTVSPAGKTRSRIIEHRMVEDVKEFGPELEVYAFGFERDSLKSAHVESEHAGAAKNTSAQSSSRSNRICCKCSRVEPRKEGIASRLSRTHAGCDGAVVPQTGQGIILAARYRQRRTGLELLHSRQLPASERRAGE